ncbi:winged helix-turn-helix domain-containing protein [Mycobacteroides abscessus]|uniref:winged helix-turn-helix domain-containing protein n=1 Tax=Mycobacteroides abscessus TaxID=36809 RepID=UPI0009A58335|nr:winged helix-turn-helix domain-containing protein [Mycobacteroides abscessus]
MAVEERLAVRAARRRVDERELGRAIFEAARDGGLSQRQISDIVGIYSQATIQRILRRFTEDPSLLEETPAEVIDRRAAEMITGRQMMAKLLRWKYSFGAVARVNGVATDAYTAGDWDEVEMAYYRGLLSDNEFHQLSSHQVLEANDARVGTGGDESW